MRDTTAPNSDFIFARSGRAYFIRAASLFSGGQALPVHPPPPVTVSKPWNPSLSYFIIDIITESLYERPTQCASTGQCGFPRGFWFHSCHSNRAQPAKTAVTIDSGQI